MLRTLRVLVGCTGLACAATPPEPPPPEPHWLGFQASSLSLAAGGSQARGLRAADVSGDGVVDLVLIASREEQVCILEGSQGGAFSPPRALTAGKTPMDVAVQDMNRDGQPDLLVVGHFSNTLAVRLGSGRGAFQEPVSYSLGNHSQQVRVADLDGDGDLDVMTKNAGSAGFFNITLLAGRGDGTLEAATPYSVTGLPRDLTLADVNADGLPDVLVLNTNSYTVDVLLGQRSGALAPLPPYQLQRGEDNEPFRFAALDVNGDARLDLVISHALGVPGHLSVHLGNGEGGFTASSSIPVEEPGEVVAADFNRDGRPDLALTRLSGGVFLLLGAEGGTFGDPVRVASGPPPTSLLAADVNADGFADLAWTTQDTVEVLLAATAPVKP
ncbi:FG-GAP repeat domain-containing protein [Pyxidicoccus sp. MSG2]|uniref:FG-GAP repeat domain-containing protein n=1 Tax=Pyxidicoccus sp. MSG2 TaxID=2996790 RepID=UPI00226F28B3|nr:VCBS repeat-containing protein [Pyxidicoccus sp. MSG2]MCY1020003.1 VCBS repeat-containing protein [Pyxidicoccus sp. MSG2]